MLRAPREVVSVASVRYMATCMAQVRVWCAWGAYGRVVRVVAHAAACAQQTRARGQASHRYHNSKWGNMAKARRCRHTQACARRCRCAVDSGGRGTVVEDKGARYNRHV